MKIRSGGRSLNTTRSIAQIALGVVFNASSHLYDFCRGSDCMKAQFAHECCGKYTRKSEAEERRVPCVAAVDGACCS